MQMRTGHTKICGIRWGQFYKERYSPKYQDKQIKTTATIHPRVKTSSLAFTLRPWEHKALDK